MSTAASAARPLALLPQAAVPVRSPRTSIILAELARQRRLERYQRRCKRQRRRHAWARVAAWFGAFEHSPRKPSGAQGPPAAGLAFAAGSTPLVYAPQPCW